MNEMNKEMNKETTVRFEEIGSDTIRFRRSGYIDRHFFESLFTGNLAKYLPSEPIDDAKVLDWNGISQEKLTDTFIMMFSDYINWEFLTTRNPHVSSRVLCYAVDFCKVDLDVILKANKDLPDKFILHIIMYLTNDQMDMLLKNISRRFVDKYYYLFDPELLELWGLMTRSIRHRLSISKVRPNSIRSFL